MILSRLFRKKASQKFYAPIAPDAPFVAIGDVHGRVDLLERLIGKLSSSERIVCVGDYIDRGENSAAVLRLLSKRKDIICLSGNHEEMMLNFLSAPTKHGPRWLRYGGLQTLASFRITGIRETSDTETLTKARDALLLEMGQDLLDWLQNLPSYWQSGNVAVVHASADPTVPIEYQKCETLHWGHPGFAERPREDGIWVVHGHTTTDEPTVEGGRIAIDTGAYATGRLTAARIDRDRVEFIGA